MSLLSGKRAIVTGSGRGLGRAYAIALAREGAQVVVNGTTPELVHAVAAEITAEGGKAIACPWSISTFDGAEQLVQAAVDAFGGVDILVNNAGVIAERMMFNMTDAEFRGPMDVDYYGTFACSRHAARDMKTRGWGRIINTGDGSAQHGALGGTNVAAAKGGIHAMTYTWAIELARYGITVNCVIPGAYTRMHDPLYKKAVELAEQRGDTDAPSFDEMVAAAAKPEEITPFLVYLASDEADWVTGQVFSMHRDEIALWSHPVEKSHFAGTGALTLDDMRANARRAFEQAIEPVGRQQPWSGH
ncbi:MAG: SDR family NAD(P)-dependent oxidoreductase [Dehalococcoidia bacterium]|nr:SDR family NAD(P)-dependent oxidoreductase [Dehalococcoidia bacterium]